MACLKKMKPGNTVTAINSALSTSETITLGNNAGITAYYRYNGLLCEVWISGKLSGVNFTAWTGYTIGTLPEKYRPKRYMYVKLEGGYYIQINPDGLVQIISSSNVTNATASLSGQTMYFL